MTRVPALESDVKAARAYIKELEQDRNEWKCSQQAYKAEAEELREFKRKIEIERITALASLPPEELARRIDKAIDELLEAGNE